MNQIIWLIILPRVKNIDSFFLFYKSGSMQFQLLVCDALEPTVQISMGIITRNPAGSLSFHCAKEGTGEKSMVGERNRKNKLSKIKSIS